MEWLKTLIKKNPSLSMLLPVVLSFTSLFSNLVTAFSDGKIDGSELHSLLTSVNSIEMMVLIIIVVALKDKKK
jgi:hypothetical protein